MEEELAEAIEGMVVRASGNVEGAGGVSFYMPGYNKTLYGSAQDLYTEKEILSESYWEFVKAYTESWTKDGRINWKMPDFQKVNGELLLQLTPEQAAGASEIY